MPVYVLLEEGIGMKRPFIARLLASSSAKTVGRDVGGNIRLYFDGLGNIRIGAAGVAFMAPDQSAAIERRC